MKKFVIISSILILVSALVLSGCSKAAPKYNVIKIGAVLGLALIAFAHKSTDFRKSFDNVLGGLVVGLAVLGAWYISSTIQLNIDDEMYSLRSYVENWDFVSDGTLVKPAAFAPLSSQSYTFINPIGQVFGYVKGGFAEKYLTFGIMAVAGVMKDKEGKVAEDISIFPE